MLNQQLKELQAHGMVRKISPHVLPSKAEYFLTPSGESLLPIVEAMKEWGDTHGDELRALLTSGPPSSTTQE